MRLTVFFLISGEIPELMVYVGIKFKLLSYLESSKSNKLYKNPWVTVYSKKKYTFKYLQNLSTQKQKKTKFRVLYYST